MDAKFSCRFLGYCKLWCTLDGAKYGNTGETTLGYRLWYAGIFRFSLKINTASGEIVVSIPWTSDRIYLGLNERTEKGSKIFSTGGLVLCWEGGLFFMVQLMIRPRKKPESLLGYITNF